MREYKIPFEGVLDLSIKRFWFLVNQVERLRAEENIRHVHMAAAAGGQEGIDLILSTLIKEMGQVYVWQERPAQEITINLKDGLDPEFDRSGLQGLKNMGSVR